MREPPGMDDGSHLQRVSSPASIAASNALFTSLTFIVQSLYNVYHPRSSVLCFASRVQHLTPRIQRLASYPVVSTLLTLQLSPVLQLLTDGD